MKQPRATDTHNTFINRHCMGGGSILKVTVPPKVLLGKKKEGDGAGLLINYSKHIAGKVSGYRIHFELQTNPCLLR